MSLTQNDYGYNEWVKLSYKSVKKVRMVKNEWKFSLLATNICIKFVPTQSMMETHNVK